MAGWSRPLIGVDRHRGSEMFAVLALQKLMMLISALVSLTVLSFLLLPYLVLACNFSLDHCQPMVDLTNSTSDSSSAWWWSAIYFSHREGGTYKRIPFYYGFLEVTSEAEVNDISQALSSHLPIIYLAVTSVCQIGLIIYFGGQLKGFIKRAISEDTSDSWFKSLYSSWNHNVVCKTSSLLKHKSVYRHLKQKLQLAKSFAKARTCCTRCLVVAARVLSVLFTLVAWTCVVLAVHFAVLMQLKPLESWLPWVGSQLAWSGPVSYAMPVALFSLTKVFALALASLLEKWECYTFNLRVVVYTGRLFVSRAAALFTLVSTIFHLRISDEYKGFCWEDHLCNQLVSLALADLVFDWILVLLIRFPRVLLASLYKREWSCSTKLNFDPYEVVVDLVFDLGLLSSGLLYCPLLPILVFAKLCLGYPLRIIHIWVNCSASRDIHSPSCIRFLFIGFAAVMLLFCSLLLAFGIAFNPVSEHCGPFADLKHMSDAVSLQWQGLFGSKFPTTDPETPDPDESIEKPANSLTLVTIVMSSLIVILLFGLYVSHLKRLYVEKSATQLKCQLAMATQEKCYLISKIKKPKH